ncbi:MAG: hypothetical protein EA404_13680 [Spirochaetaceae bacterium]|nr:MAG: hypothetical protein EA404_13680 [Spirochaetaceae bacterium]
MATVRALLLLPLLLLLGACDLFYDPAAPPFDDRIVLMRTVDDIFGDLHSDVEMTVLDNGSRHFLLVHGRDRHGEERTVAFDSRLRVRMNRPHLWEVRHAYVDVNGDFVIDQTLFSGTDFSLLSDNVYSDPPPNFPAGGIATAAGTVIVRVENSVLRAGPLYGDDWNFSDIDSEYVEDIDVHPGPVDPDPLNGFELRAAQHDSGRGRSGLVLWNSEISRTFVIEISAQLAVDMQAGDFAGSHVTDEAPYLVLSANKDSPVFYTRRGVVLLHDSGQHRVYKMDSGRRSASYDAGRSGEFAFAYSPDGDWLYWIDLSRRTLYKGRTWW